MPLDALVSLVMTFNEGIMLERLSGIETGHRELLDWIDGWLSRRRAMTTTERHGAASRRARATRTRTGYVERDGVRVFYEVYGEGEPTVLFVPTVVDRPLAALEDADPVFRAALPRRHLRPRGNGRSDRPQDAEAYAEREFAADALAVLDATGTERAVLVALSLGAQRALVLAAEHPERVDGVVFIAPSLPLAPPPRPRLPPFDEPLDTDEGWAKFNAHYWLRDYRGFARVLHVARCFTEPHSTKPIEDASAGALETTPRRSSPTHLGPELDERGDPRALRARPARCWSSTAKDAISPRAGASARGGDRRRARADRGRGSLPARARPGAGQPAAPRLRRPPPRPARAGCAASRGASARSTSRRRSGSAMPGATSRSRTSCASCIPTSRSTGWRSTRSRPCSRRAASGSTLPARYLANESRHIESESAEHDLHCFQAIRRMDEILVANFMVFHDLVRDEQYDLWIGDEAWELDYYLHENPEQKRAAYVWLTDFVGWLPMPDGGEHEAFVTADYNAEMIEHIARFPRVRDRAIFVGNPDDIVARRIRRRPAADPRLDGAALRLRRVHHRVRSGRARGPRALCAPSSATGRTSRCASSPSAARASAVTCCGA